MQEVRRRKKKVEKPTEKTPANVKKEIHHANDLRETAAITDGTFWKILYVLLGLTVAGLLGYRYAVFIKPLHENDMWFSEISVS